MTFIIGLFLVMGLCLVGVGVWLIYNTGEVDGWFLSSLGLLFIILSITLWISFAINEAKVDALVESGKYEVVTNYEYSGKELEQFKKVGEVYLKEVE